MNIQTEIKPVDNGVNVEALLGAREALGDMPAAAEFTWKASCEWMGGVHSRSTVEGFFGLGEEKQHKQPFTIEADHPAEFAHYRFELLGTGRLGSRTVCAATVLVVTGSPTGKVRAENFAAA